jgi:hypothetical protein
LSLDKPKKKNQKKEKKEKVSATSTNNFLGENNIKLSDLDTWFL